MRCLHCVRCVKAKDKTASSCIVKGLFAHVSSAFRCLIPSPTQIQKNNNNKNLSTSPKSVVFINPVLTAAGNAFCQAARLHIQLQNKLDSATSFVDAGNAYKKADPQGECVTVSLTHSAAVMRFFSSKTARQRSAVDIKCMGVIVSVFAESSAHGCYITEFEALYNNISCLVLVHYVPALCLITCLGFVQKPKVLFTVPEFFFFPEAIFL